MLEVAIGVLIAVVVSGALRLFVASHRKRMGGLRFHRDRFFDIAARILLDDTIDDGVLVRIKAMTEDIDQAKAFRAVRMAVIEIDKEIRAGTFRPKPVGVRPEIWGSLAFHYFLALSYSRPIEGWFLRGMLAGVLDPVAGNQNADLIDRRIHDLQIAPA